MVPAPGVCATAVSSRVGLVHPNIHIVLRKKVWGTGLFCPWTVASMGSRYWPEALYRSWRASSCSFAKNSTAGPERKATSMNLGLHCLYMREAASSSFFGCAWRDGEDQAKKDLKFISIISECVRCTHHGNFFSVQRLQGFRQVVTQALTCRKLN